MDILIGAVILIIIFGAMGLGVWMKNSARIDFLKRLQDKEDDENIK